MYRALRAQTREATLDLDAVTEEAAEPTAVHPAPLMIAAATVAQRLHTADVRHLHLAAADQGPLMAVVVRRLLTAVAAEAERHRTVAAVAVTPAVDPAAAENAPAVIRTGITKLGRFIRDRRLRAAIFLRLPASGFRLPPGPGPRYPAIAGFLAAAVVEAAEIAPHLYRPGRRS